VQEWIFGLGLEERDGTTRSGKRTVYRNLVDRVVESVIFALLTFGI
jgi:hypothetical protein